MLRKITAIVAPFFGQLLIRLIYFSSRIKYTLPEKIPKKPYIAALWHGELLMQIYLYRKMRKDTDISVMISEHFDGQLIASTVKYFGLKTIRGSSNKGASRVLLKAIKAIKNGEDIAITPDGPRGPRHSIADGVIAIAQKLDIPIVAQNINASSYWQLNSWDKFVIPKPFGTIELIASEPFYVTNMKKDEARALIYSKMIRHAI